jgi:hypothetical protein
MHEMKTLWTNTMGDCPNAAPSVVAGDDEPDDNPRSIDCGTFDSEPEVSDGD